ncbi:MAG: 30S ribosomal protein S4 [Dehalococcoidia bacterium]|nr:30S ribosomal protein S4 [Dehalococcoidia bacterium]
MARYTGPVCRKCRALNEKLMLKGDKCYTPKCPLERKTAQAPRSRFRRRISERGIQLHEKQKVRFSYGLMEKQFRGFFARARKMTGVTGDNFMTLLERRLDNVVYRVGFADSRAQARQIVRHGHIVVNKRKVDIPSYLVEEGDDVQWREASAKTECYKVAIEKAKKANIPAWLSLDQEKMIATVSVLPGRDAIVSNLNSQAIVEYYSR